MKQIKILFGVVILVMTLMACEKSEESVADGASSPVLDNGTAVSNNETCYDSVMKYISCMNIMRNMGGPSAYYDGRLLSIPFENITNTYYVGKNGIKIKPIVMGEEMTIISIDQWFTETLEAINNILPDVDSTYAGSYSPYIGRWGKWKRFNEYDLYGISIKPGTGCQTGRLRINFVALIFVAQYV
jgi:hypothetical protein